MASGLAYPSYFCPEGVSLPKHCGWSGVLMSAEVEGTDGPGDQPGKYWGGEPYNPRTKAQWKKAKDGWWMLVDDWRQPAHFARMRLLGEGSTIEGVMPEHQWLIPQLLRWHPEAYLVSAVPEVLKNDEWHPPAHLIPIMERLKSSLLVNELQTVPKVHDMEAVHLVCDIIGLNYHIGYSEISILGWLSTSMVPRILMAAGGVYALQDSTATMRRQKGQHHGQ